MKELLEIVKSENKDKQEIEEKMALAEISQECGQVKLDQLEYKTRWNLYLLLNNLK